MFRTAARRMISTTTQVYPPIPPSSASMFHHGANMAAAPSNNTTARRGLASVRWVPTIFALVSIGYGISAYRSNQLSKYYSRSAEMREAYEQERRRQQAVLMDAYGDKSSLADLEKAMATYERSQRG